jgi:hypothetical protein
MKVNCNNHSNVSETIRKLDEIYALKKYKYEKTKDSNFLKKLNRIESRIDKIFENNEKFLEKYVCEYCLVFASCKFNEVNCDKFKFYQFASLYAIHKKSGYINDSNGKLLIRKSGGQYFFQVFGPDYTAKKCELKFHNEIATKIEKLPYYSLL